MEVPLVDLAWQHREIAGEVESGWQAVVENTAFVGGKVVAVFEQAFAAAVGASSCLGVANGTDALEIALRCVGVEPGAEVVMPANTFIATAFAAMRCGAKPRLVDVDPATMLIDAALIDAADCAAVVPVHLFGQMAPMAAVLAAAGDVPVVEDAAQAQGATQDGRGIGAFGAVAATSFYPGKNLGAYGDAGAVVTNDDALADRMRLMANHGSASKYDHQTFGFNSRLDPLQAVVLNAKLQRLQVWNEDRRAAASRYDELLADLQDVRTLTVAPGNVAVWHLYPIRVPERDRVLAHLQSSGVGAGVHYPVPVHLQPAMAFLGHGPGDFPVTEQAAASMISLPLYPGITSEQQDRVVSVLVEALS